MRLMTKFAPFALSAYLVRAWLIGSDRFRLKESAIIIKSSLIDK